MGFKKSDRKYKKKFQCLKLGKSRRVHLPKSYKIMEDKHKELLALHRSKFIQSVEVERIFPFLQATEVLNPGDIQEIESQQSRLAKVEKLLDILPSKGSQAFQTLCLALETTYPHLLTIMFLGSNKKVTGSTTASLTSDSEDDSQRHSLLEEKYTCNVSAEIARICLNEDARQENGCCYTMHQSQLSRVYAPSANSSPRPLTPPDYDLHQNNLALLKAELKLVTHDRDTLRQQLERTQKERDSAFKRLAMNGDSKSTEKRSSRDYDWLKAQCERAMSELQSLKQQHGESVKKCDTAMKEADFFRNKNKKMLTSLEQSHAEIVALKSQYNENIINKNRLEQEVTDLQKLHQDDRQEIEELRQQQREVMTERGSNEVLNKMYDTALDKYEALKSDHDALRKRYADVIASHSAAVSKLELMQEENERLKKQCDEVLGERNAAILERNGLKQQCTAAIRQWDNALRERNELKEALSKTRQQRDEAIKEINQAMAVRLKATKDLTRLTEERNAAVQEYSLIMSERDSVHKEIEKLQDELSAAFKQINSVENDRKVALEEVETLRREIASALHDRDRALKECNDLREKYGDIVSAKEEAQKERDEAMKDFEMFKHERDIARKERTEALDHRDQILRECYEKRQRDKLENLDQANVEIEALRKQIDALQSELQEAQQEADVAKRRRDWAFSERDKIVLERESIRTLCDKLRRERDRAVSELAEALRDSDDVKKQRNEATKELKELREKIEAQLEKESRMKQLNSVCHNHSRDSAIDTDLQEWETETLEFNIGGINDDDLGFDLVGGKDDPQYPNDSSIFVSSVVKGSIADGKLKVNDCVLRVNNIDLTNVERKAAFDAVRSSGGVLNMVVRRRRSTLNRLLHSVQLNLTGNKEHGLSFEMGLYISRIAPGSTGAKEGNLAVGDRIVNINGKGLENKGINDLLRLLEDCGDTVILSIMKTGISSSAPISSSSSGHNIVENLDAINGNISPNKDQYCNKSTKKFLTNSQNGSNDHVNRNCIKTFVLPSDSEHNKENLRENKNKPKHESLLDRAYEKIFGEKRHEKKEREEKLRASKLKATAVLPEEDAIAELDSIIQHYQKNSSNKGHKMKRKKEKENDKNGGTWPKYRGPPPDYSEPGTVPILQTHKKKERKSVISLTVTPKHIPGLYEAQYFAGSRKPPILCDRGASFLASFKHNSQSTESKGGLFITNPKVAIETNCSQQVIAKKVIVEEEHEDESQDHVPVVHFATNSTPDSAIDYSVVSAQRDKDILEYYKNKREQKRPKSAPSHRQDKLKRSLSPELAMFKTTSLDAQALYPSRSYNSRSPVSPSDPLNLSPRTADRYHSGHIRTSPHVYPSPSSIPAQTTVLRSTNSVPFYTVNSQRIPHGGHSTLPAMASPPMFPLLQRYGSPPSLLNSSIPETDAVPPLYTRLSDGHFNIAPSPSPSQQSSIAHSPCQSMDLHFPLSKKSAYHPYPPFDLDGTSTFPKRSQHRMRIPSNQSVTSKSSVGRVSTSSIERASVSDRSSPMLPFISDSFSQAPLIRNSTTSKQKRPSSKETRSIHIEKSSEQLGIQIDCGSNGGIFVSSVGDNSLASQAGLHVGDQLLEVCGINMRSATYSLAANVLRQCGESITMLVQYNPDKYKNEMEDSSSSGQASPSPSLPGSPQTDHSQSQLGNLEPTQNSPLQEEINILCGHLSEENNSLLYEPRFVFLKGTKSNLGISLIGGNSVGVFVHAVQPDSPACGLNGLQCGDQILEFNGVNLRTATAEQAAYELAKHSDTVTILAQYNIAKYNEIQDQPGDSFYIRALFDRNAETEEELSFKKDNILYIDNTLFNGITGSWRAWLVDEDGHKRQCGIIPSKYRVEEENHLKHSISETSQDNGESRRTSTSARRSFFRRRKHQRNNSKDSKELASFSDMSINSDSITLVEDISLPSYQKVERLDYLVPRPVIIIGPLSEAIIEKLIQENSHQFHRCLPEIMEGSQQAMEKGVQDNLFVDYRRKGSHFECTTLISVKEICEKNCHCILDVSLVAIERLQQLQLYPIVLFIKFKSAKQIKEAKDSRYLHDKVTNKIAKELLEFGHKLESEYKHSITGVIVGGSLNHICNQIKITVDQEQSKTLWIPCVGL